MSRKRLILLLVVTACLLTTARPQQPQNRNVPTGLVLEITYLEGTRPAYEQITRIKLPKGVGSWFGRFGRVAGWQLPPGAQPISAVRVAPYLESEIVSVTFSVLRGERFMDIEDMVGTYALRENEALSIDALKNFGVEPFKIKVIRVAPQSTDVPSIVNKTKSVEVVGLEPLVSTFPRYKLTVHNLSDKNISALKIYIMHDDKVELSWMPQGDDGAALIGAGGSSELKEMLSTRAQATPDGFTPEALHNQQIVIGALIFEDGSYEGEAEAAATYRAFAIGNRTELKRIVPLLESAPVSAEALRSQLATLGYEFNEAETAALAKAFPATDRARLQSQVEVAMHYVRKDLLDGLERFQNESGPAGDFRICLQGMRDRYSSWLARLERRQ
jgi:hypothetical protein